ncbi:DUF4215 domain-containing protein [Pseudenhygromyxa sp. WMMC2535]|uniref:DUF4215 domain-containing protein n=1 Tax=Pseudenhygromyxa sp. WMMC2535 TaxID=2712867 RepID=UPI0015571D24|nr:DUF4215 domain-containing protein [Pseudenhygromyxa sp. WMMC2535]NVB38516.1 DUF4215 domain-containing protein [Pseudenhygromyxa sp. WMMC2535]
MSLRLSVTSLLALSSLFLGCKGGESDDGADGTETAGTETAGDSSSGDENDDDDDDDDDDSSGESTTSEGCTYLGCDCDDSAGSCDAGLACVDGVCAETLCGDGEVQGEEECDDANEIDGDGCDSDCTATAVSALSLGENHTCALIDGGSVRCWGRGEFGQLGYGNALTVGDDELPSDVGDILLPGPAVSLRAGGQHTCAIFEDGGLRCWGLNDRGQLGYGDVNNRGDDENLAGLAAIGVASAISVEPGARHTCARVGNGEVRCWGANDSGQLGYGNTLDMVPVLELLVPGEALTLGGTAAGLAGGGYHNCVSFVDGGVRCWGANASGQLGYGDVANIGDDELPNAAGLVSLIPATLPPNTEVVDVELGGSHSCALLGSGDVLCWGANASGQLGLGNTNPIGDDETPNTQLAVSLPGAVKQLALGANHTCALLTTGAVSCWGDNQVGQLGLGNTDNVGDDEAPTAVGTVELGGNALTIAAGSNHTCALLENHDVRCWGQNNYSQLGLGSIVTIGDNETPAEKDPVSVL